MGKLTKWYINSDIKAVTRSEKLEWQLSCSTPSSCKTLRLKQELSISKNDFDNSQSKGKIDSKQFEFKQI